MTDDIFETEKATARAERAAAREARAAVNAKRTAAAVTALAACDPNALNVDTLLTELTADARFTTVVFVVSHGHGATKVVVDRTLLRRVDRVRRRRDSRMRGMRACIDERGLLLWWGEHGVLRLQRRDCGDCSRCVGSGLKGTCLFVQIRCGATYGAAGSCQRLAS